jgi:Sulfate permease and related transporters (MFS superfamily)
LQQLPQLCTIPLVSALSFLLISSGMEAAGRRDLDLNRELIINGMANLLAGPGGSHSGYTAMSFSMFGPKTGSDSRLVGVSAALFVGAATFFGAQLLGNFPRFILGGMVLFLGIATLQDWIIDARRRVSTLDYLLMLSILGVIAFFGFLAGAGFGLLAATALFAIRYSRLPVLREEQDGTTRLSALERPIPHRRLLHQHGHDIRILRATGYLFFGSANVLADSVAQRLGKDPQGTPPPSHLILDFSGVDGFDSSAVNSFLRLLQRAEAAGTQLVFSATPAMLPDQLRRADAVQAEGARFFADLDRALEWCEDAVLARELERLESQKNTGESNALFDASVDDMMLQLERAERFETLLERLDPRLEHKTAEAGQVFLHQGEPINGLLLLVSGQAEEIRNEADGTQTRQRTLSAGAVVGHTGHAQHFQAPGTLTALSPCALVLLSAQALHRLEAEEPENALLLYSHVSSELHSLLWPASAPAPNNS